MSKKYMYLFGAALLALSGVGVSVQSVNAKTMHRNRTNVTRNYQRYFVNAPQSISSHARNISGTANRGIRVVLQNNKKAVAKTYANRKTGRYTLRVPKRYRAGTQLTVMDQKGYVHPYKIVLVKTSANQKAAVQANRKGRNRASKVTNKSAVNRNHKVVKGHAKKVIAKHNSKRANKRKARSKKTNRKSVRRARTNRVTVKTPNGNWQTRSSRRGYVQRWSLTQKRGLNESLYHNGRFVKKLVTNAPYKVNSVKNNVWTITYRVHGQKKSQQMVMRFLTNDHFNVTSQNGRHANLNFLRY